MIRLNSRLSKSRLSNRDQVILFLLVNVAALLAFFFLVYQPSMKELSTLRDENTETRQTMQLLEAAKKEHAQLTRDHLEVVLSAAATLAKFPRESDLPAIMATVDKTVDSRGAKTEVITYAQVQWDKGMGRTQVTALFSGTYATIASLVVDLPRLLPSALVEQVRITPQRTESLTQAMDSAVEPSVVSTLNKALGLSNHVASGAIPSANLVEAQIVLSVYLAGNANTDTQGTEKKDEAEKGSVVDAARLTELLGGQGIWYPAIINRWRGAETNPFNPSDKAIELVNTIRLVERYRDVKVTGIVHVGNQSAASVQYQGKNKTLRNGDYLDEAKVTGITDQGITLEILGRSIFIQLGGIN